MSTTSSRRKCCHALLGSVVASSLGMTTCANVLAAGQPLEVLSVAQPVCDRLPDTGYEICTNVSEIEVLIPTEVKGAHLVQCLLYSQEQQILGIGEAVLRSPGGRLWVVLRPYYRFGQVTLHASTRCEMVEAEARR